MDSDKYQSDIIHDIEMTYERVVFPQRKCIFMHHLAPYDNSKSTRQFLECREILVLEWSGNSADINLKETFGI